MAGARCEKLAGEKWMFKELGLHEEPLPEKFKRSFCNLIFCVYSHEWSC